MKAATEKPNSTIADEELLSDESSESEEDDPDISGEDEPIMRKKKSSNLSSVTVRAPKRRPSHDRDDSP